MCQICSNTARKTILSFSRRPEKIVFPKKLRWNLIFLVLLEKVIFLFRENMILPRDGKWKMIFLKKIIILKYTEIWYLLQMFWKRWSFQKGPRRDMILLVLSGQVVFFPKNMLFFSWMENERGVTFLKKYTETWYFLFDMFPAKKNQRRSYRKNTPKGDWHSRSKP